MESSRLFHECPACGVTWTGYCDDCWLCGRTVESRFPDMAPGGQMVKQYAEDDPTYAPVL